MQLEYNQHYPRRLVRGEIGTSDICSSGLISFTVKSKLCFALMPNVSTV